MSRKRKAAAIPERGPECRVWIAREGRNIARNSIAVKTVEKLRPLLKTEPLLLGIPGVYAGEYYRPIA